MSDLIIALFEGLMYPFDLTKQIIRHIVVPMLIAMSQFVPILIALYFGYDKLAAGIIVVQSVALIVYRLYTIFGSDTPKPKANDDWSYSL
jgi:hypothetical protein